jgi:anhydro-N-acetylmuramic acid kinase
VNRLERLIEIARKKERLVVGLMSGTSVDAIDAVLVRITGERDMEPLRFQSFPFPDDIRSRVKTLFDPINANIREICHLDFVLGELFAGAVNRLIREAGMKNEDVDLVAAPGQTIWHRPKPVDEPTTGDLEWLDQQITTRSTLAIGQSAVIAERTGIVTVGDLRVRDIAAGGHGAPLVAYFDWVHLRDETRGRCVQNIGGIANVTYLPPNGDLGDVIAFDTGPGNMVIDELVFIFSGSRESFDRDGARAARGRVLDDVLQWCLANPYFDLAPPKTTGRERFGRQFARKVIEEFPNAEPDDLVATATALTAQSIAGAYARWIKGPVDDVIIAGGGGKNPVLLDMLRTRLPKSVVSVYEHLEEKEAMAMARIANDSILGLATNVPSATGGRPAVLGKICL